MKYSRELPYPIHPSLESLKQFEPGLYSVAGPTLCELTPNFLIDALILKAVNGPSNCKLVKKRNLFIGYCFERYSRFPSSSIKPNFATKIFMKDIGVPAGIVLGEPYQGLIVTEPEDKQVQGKAVYVNRIWNDYPIHHHLETNALNEENYKLKLTPEQIEDYYNVVADLSNRYTWASQAFLYLLKTQLNITISENSFAISRRSSPR